MRQAYPDCRSCQSADLTPLLPQAVKFRTEDHGTDASANSVYSGPLMF